MFSWLNPVDEQDDAAQEDDKKRGIKQGPVPYKPVCVQAMQQTAEDLLEQERRHGIDEQSRNKHS